MGIIYAVRRATTTRRRAVRTKRDFHHSFPALGETHLKKAAITPTHMWDEKTLFHTAAPTTL